MRKNQQKGKHPNRAKKKRTLAPALISRRSFLKFSYYATLLGVAADTAGLSHWFKLGKDKLRYGLSIPETTQVAAKALFGIRQHHTSIVPAASNPNVRERLIRLTAPVKVHDREEMMNYFSQATVDASTFLQPLLQDPVSKLILGYTEVDELVRANPREQIIAFGTPTSNSLVRYLMCYQEYEDAKEGHEYKQNDAIHLPILFELRRSMIAAAANQRDAWYRPKAFGVGTLPDLIPNWGIALEDGELILPATDGSGRLFEDFLVISSLPNVLHSESVERELPVVCIGGTHSVGTLAFKDVLEDKLLLSTIEQELRSLGNPPFWQAVIRAELDPSSSKVSSLFLEKKLIKKVEVNTTLLMQVAESSAKRQT